MGEKIIYGNMLVPSVPVRVQKPEFALFGRDSDDHIITWPIDDSTLSKHLLLLGAIGMGKSNAMNHLVRSLRARMTENDIMFIFDTKGDYYKEFYEPGLDVVISNDHRATGGKAPDYWNIFKEIMADDRETENATEIARAIFAERLEKTTQVFFPNAAKDLLAALLLCICRSGLAPEEMNNKQLLKVLQKLDSKVLISYVKQYSDTKNLVSYIQGEDSGQTLGVISELQGGTRDLLVGNFAKPGGLSMRQLVRSKGKRAVFIEYDLGIGGVLTPIYRLLFDLAIKEALCRERATGNVYFIIDEFSLLPLLEHIDDGVNFGRSLGARFIIGAQNVSQIYDAYGEERACSLLSGFSTTICFRLNDGKTFERVSQVSGGYLYLTRNNENTVEQFPEAPDPGNSRLRIMALSKKTRRGAEQHGNHENVSELHAAGFDQRPLLRVLRF